NASEVEDTLPQADSPRRQVAASAAAKREVRGLLITEKP
ncbi:MAG: hypothetical protein RIS46_939, partial [Actinomycetota bacterium]